MAKEEILINETLWKHYTDEQLILVNQKLVTSIPIEEKTLASKWMMRAANNIEIINWPKGVRDSAPDFVFQSLFSLTETELPEYRREIVQDGVLGNQKFHKELLDNMMA